MKRILLGVILVTVLLSGCDINEKSEDASTNDSSTHYKSNYIMECTDCGYTSQDSYMMKVHAEEFEHSSYTTKNVDKFTGTAILN